MNAKTFILLSILIMALSAQFISIIPISYADEPTGKLNGLTVVLDTIGSSITVSQIITFMETYHYNALKIYTGWCSSYWGSSWTGDVDDPIPTAAKTKITSLIQSATEHDFYVLCTISDQITPAKTNDTWHDYEVQVGWEGPNSDLNSQDNWLDYTGPSFIRHQTALVETFVTLMQPYCKPRVGLEEMQYISGGGHPAFYAQSMKDAYFDDTGLSVPYFASTSTGWSGWNTTQRNFILYANATIRDFYDTMYEAAIAINNTAQLHAMTDDLVYYQTASPYIYYTQPIDFFGNDTVFEATEIECYGAVGGSIWTRVQACLDICEVWNPSADHFLTYGWYSGASASEIQTAVTMAMNDDYRGVWAYSYNSGGSAFRTNPLDVSDYIPEVTPPVAVFTKNASTIYEGETVSFDASSSYDPDGIITSWDWDFGDGNTSATETANNTFVESGVYTVTLTVMDNSSLIDDTSQIVTVLEAEASETGFEMGFDSFTVASKLGFMCGPNQTLLLTINGGNLSSQNITANIQRDSGDFAFISLDDVAITLEISELAVAVRGDNGSDWRGVADGATLNIETGDSIGIKWSISAEVYDWFSWMIMPAIGIFGFCLCGFGVFYVGSKIRERDFAGSIRAMLWCMMIILIGAGLVIGWLW